MKSLHHALREKEKRMVALQREIEVLRAATRIVGGSARVSAPRINGRKLSQPQMMRAVLLEHGRPLQVEKLAEAVEKKFRREIEKE